MITVGLATAAALLLTPAAQGREVEALISAKASDGYHVKLAISRPGLNLAGLLFKRTPETPMAKAGAMTRGDLARTSAAARLSGRPGSVAVLVKSENSRRQETLTAYQSRAAVTSRRVRSGLGRLGRLSMRFHERAKRRVKLASFCSGRVVKRTGIFTGRLRFRGEGGYTKVRSHRASGKLITLQHVRCRASHAAKRLGSATLFADSRNATFSVSGFRKGSLMLTSARSQLGRMQIVRTGQRFAGPGEFEPEPDLSAAHVEPRGSLFSGSADFTAPSAWTGSLAATFPGATVPMAGADFRAELGFDGTKPP